MTSADYAAHTPNVDYRHGADEHTEQTHRYLSTACLHGFCGDCDIDATRWDGTRKIAASCKYCQAPCICPHHRTAAVGEQE